jgi:hypothetical protein
MLALRLSCSCESVVHRPRWPTVLLASMDFEWQCGSSRLHSAPISKTFSGYLFDACPEAGGLSTGVNEVSRW